MALFGRTKTDLAPAQPVPPTPVPEPRRLGDAPSGDENGVRSVAEHRDYLLSQVQGLRPFGIGLLEASGLTLCESISADIDIPVVTTAAVTGWAVRGSNLVGAAPARPVRLPLVGEIDPGGFRGAPLMGGTTVKVAEGAPVPEGCDAVVVLDAGVEFGEDVEFTAEASFHENLVVAGSRIADGDRLVEAGTVLQARELGLLAEVGLDKVLARPKPRVVVASLGANLVDPGLPLERIGQVYDATTPLIAATARGDGAQVYPVGILPGDAGELRQRLSDQLLRADLVLIAADSSPVLAGVLGELGAIDEARIAIEPEVPGLFAVIGEEQVPVVVLPREAYPAYLAYQAFGRPVLHKLAGIDPAEREEITLPTLQPLTADPSRTTFLLAGISERGAVPVPVEHPGVLELAAADAVIVVGPGTGEVDAHGDVTCWPLKG
ncbi:MAG: gephyrin-like molybdotransferase Glp [Propionicimonas sp.]|uniref:molybdopterin molybdotransferase MoeA n=1 Tax=Propionicimonas sp. TaxID=1955623 RepID=UPI002B21A6C0|nr:gephyrin-like molybdotransferase Glp [Propionicimonas sp.]MEA4945791.1 gephyrin-like molybdotransferase Glp [Propionicimonas sp.]